MRPQASITFSQAIISPRNSLTSSSVLSACAFANRARSAFRSYALPSSATPSAVRSRWRIHSPSAPGSYRPSGNRGGPTPSESICWTRRTVTPISPAAWTWVSPSMHVA